MVEEIALSGNRQDVVLILGVILQGASEQVDMLGEIALFDDSFRPDPIQDLFLLDDAPGILDEKEKDLQSFLAQRNFHPLLHEAPRLRLEQEWTKFVSFLHAVFHWRHYRESLVGEGRLGP
jgi:hypothetical protein